MVEVRCKKCNKLLFKGKAAIVEIECTRCKTVNKVHLLSQEVLTVYPHKGTMKPQLGESR